MTSEEGQHWRDVALWMADVIAATAEHQLMLKSVGRREKERHIRIAEMAADVIQLFNRPSARDVDEILDRLRRITEP